MLLLVVALAAALLPMHWFWRTDGPPLFVNLDKWLHGIAFTLLALWFAGQYARESYWHLGVGLAAYGMLIEVMQRMVPYRTADWMDFAADLAGVAVGMAIAVAGLGGWSPRFESWLENRGG